MRSRILATTLCLCLVLYMTGVVVLAAEPENPVSIQPFWVSTEKITLTMSFSNGNANWDGKIQGISGTTKISATFTLEKKNADGTFAALKTWTASSSSYILNASGSYGVSAGTYRISVTATVTPKSGSPEIVSQSLTKVF